MSTKCRYCGQPIVKIIIGWMHRDPPFYIHKARPCR